MSNIVEETLRHLKKQPGLNSVYELTEPHLLYLGPEQSRSYLDAMNQASYAGGFHRETRELIQSNLGLFTGVSRRIALVDLGPGYPDKTLPIIRACIDAGHSTTYIPVDISQHYLDISVQAVQELLPASHIIPVKGRFETVADVLPEKVEFDRYFVFLGLTYMNFPASSSCQLLCDMAGPGTEVVIATELITPGNTIDDLLGRYESEEIRAFAFGPLKNLGFSGDQVRTGVVFNDAAKRIQFEYTFKKAASGHGVDFSPDDKVITAVSYRATLDGLHADLNRHFQNSTVLVTPSGRTALAICSL